MAKSIKQRQEDFVTHAALEIYTSTRCEAGPARVSYKAAVEEAKDLLAELQASGYLRNMSSN